MKKLQLFLAIILCLFAHNVRANVSLIMENQQATQGSQITVPIKVKDFNNIISVQGTIQFNPLILSYASVQNFGLPDMNFNSFGTTQSANGKITFSWYQTQLIGQNLPDSAVIFTLKFNVIGNTGQTSPLTFSNSPTVLEIINAGFVTQTISTTNGSVSIQNQTNQQAVTLFLDTITSPANSMVVVSARVKDFVNINSVQGTLQFNPLIVSFVSFSGFGLPNMSSGNFGTSLINSGKLTFSWNDSSFTGLNRPDSTAIFSMVFHLIGNPGQQSLLALINNPTTIEVTDSLTHVLNYNLINGFIKISGQPSSNELTVKIDTAIGPQGSMVDIAVRCWNFNTIVSMQGTISFNTTIATFDTISMFGLTGMNSAGFGTSQINNGKLMFSWSDPSMTGVTLPDSSILFKIRFHLVGSAGSYTMLDFINSPTSLEFSDNTFTPVNTQYESGKAIISGNAGIILNQPTQLSYCDGNSINVSYTVNGIFINGNHFILQLSDAFGDFTNPTNLGTNISISSGSFNCIIPNNIASGTAYHLRVVSTNPVVFSNETTNNISIYEIPQAPLKPTGPILLCANPLNSTYTTHSVANAVSYNWVLYPSNAGVLNVTDTTAIVNWNNSFTGNAYIKVAAANISCTGQFSDSLLVVILPYPTTPNKPHGDTLLCINPSNSTYTINTVTNATSYSWTINPSTAGTIQPNGISAVVNWNNTYTGIIYIKVNASNGSCQGSYSDSLKVTILAHPGVPDMPHGDTLLCINPPNSTYSTNSVPGATSYIWKLTPTNAGTVTPSGLTAVVNWSNTFFGSATIKVKASNQICESVYSQVLNITINNPFPEPNKPIGDTSFCQNPDNATYYTNSIAGATNYIWSISPYYAGSISVTDTVLTVDWDNTFAGTVHIFVSATNGICNGMVSDSLKVNIYTYPSAPVADNVNACFGSTIPDLTATSTGTLNWFSDPALTTLVHTGADFATGQTAIGSYIYYVTQTIHGCESPATTVTLNISLTPSIVPISNIAVCPGTLISISNFVGNPLNTTFGWTNSNTNIGLAVDGSGNIASWAAPSNITGIDIVGSITVFPILNSCIGTPASFTVTIYPTPVINQVNDIAACPGTLINVGNFVSLPAGATFQWSNSNTTLGLATNGNGNIPQWTIPTNNTGSNITGTITVTPTLNGCIGIPMNFTITIYSNVNINQKNNIEACPGSPVNIGNFVSTPPGASFTWTNSNTNIGLTASGNGSITTWNAPANNTGSNLTGILTVTPSLNGCTGTPMTFTVTIFPTVSVPVSGGNKQACFGSTVPDLTATGSDTIKWYSDPAHTTLVHIGSSFSTGQTAIGTYNYYVNQINNNNCISSSVTITLTIHAIPSAPIANNIDACFGSTIPNLTATGTLIQWYNDSNLTNLVHTGNSFATGQTATGSYIYYVTQTVSSCESNATIVILIIHPTTVAPTAANAEVCFGSPVPDLTAVGTGTIQWYGNIGLTNLLHTGTPYATGHITTGIYSYYVTQTINTCQSAATVVTLTIDPQLATPAKPSGDSILCMNPANSTYTTQNIAGATIYNWQLTPPNAGVLSSTGTTATIDWNNTYTGTAQIKVTASNTYCTSLSSAVLTITIYAYPAIPERPHGDTLLCQNSSSVYSIQAVSGANAYMWSVYPSSAASVLATGTNATISWNNSFSGTAYINVMSVNHSCQSELSDTLKVTVLQALPSPSKPNGDTTICQNNTSTNFTTTTITGATGYIWKLNPTGAGVIVASDTTTLIYWTSGFSSMAYLSVYATNGVCNGSLSDSLLIHVIALPHKPDKPVGDTVFCQGNITSVYTTSVQNAVSYQWVLIPSSAGLVSGNGSSININWTSGFSGYVQLYVSCVNQCGSSLHSDTLDISIIQTPLQPVISVNGLILTSSYPNGNHWYLNGNSIPNATGNTYTAIQNGYYYVVYANSNGCTSVSDSIHIITVSTAFDDTTETFKLYPNPTPGIFFIDATQKTIEKVDVQDILGREIFEIYNLKTITTIDLSRENTGVYFVRLYFNGVTITRKIVKL